MNKTVLKLFLIIIAMFIIFTNCIVIAAGTTTGTVTAETARVRKSPTTSSDIVALVSIGDKIDVIAVNGDWFKIRCTYNDKVVTGYVRNDLLNVKDTSMLESETKNSQTESNTSKPSDNSSSNNSDTQNSNTNSNTNGNTNSDTAENNNSTSNQNDKTQNNLKEEEKTENKPSEKPSEETPSEEKNSTQEIVSKKLSTIKAQKGDLTVGKTITISNEIYLKLIPSVNSSNIEKINGNEQITITEVINNWCKVESGDKTGWLRIEQF